jgi:hypothetical protein
MSEKRTSHDSNETKLQLFKTQENDATAGMADEQ